MPRYQISASARSVASRGLTVVVTPGAQIEIRTLDGDLATIYADRVGLDLASNPVIADAAGNWSAWVDQAISYNVVQKSDGRSVTFAVFGGAAVGVLDPSITDEIQQAANNAAAVAGGAAAAVSVLGARVTALEGAPPPEQRQGATEW